MKAWVCKGYNFAAAQGHAAKELACVDSLPVPAPGPGEALIQVQYAAVDPIDARMLAGGYRRRYPISAFPFIPGLDAAGEVVGLGPGCERLRVGDPVVACLGVREVTHRSCSELPGAFAELCICPERQVTKVPQGTELSRVAGLPLAGLAAYQSLFTAGGCSTAGEPLGQVGEGSKVLVLGGNRSVGHLAVQLAKLAGAYVATTVPASCLEWMVSLGANHVISFREEDWADTLKGQGFDLIVDCVGWAITVEEMDRAGEVLSSDGLYVSTSELDAFEGLGRRYGCQFRAMVPTVVTRDLDLLVEWVMNGRLQVAVDQVCAFRDLRHALHECTSGHCRGKVLVRRPHMEPYGGA